MKNRYNELFDFHSAPEETTSTAGAIVFGRKDKLVAHALVDLAADSKVDWAILTGGKGKDSADLDIPEAEYLAREAELYADTRRVQLPRLILETQATNGGENSRNSLNVMRRAQFGHQALTVISHATSLRRLAHLLNHTAIDSGVSVGKIYRTPSRYDFNASNQVDRDEVIAETMRLLEWPGKGWLQPDVAQEVPADLADFARDMTCKNRAQ